VIVPVILCGGAGTRLWPASRQDLPKPFLPLVDGVSTFAMTLARVAEPSIFAPPIVVANATHRGLVVAALAEIPGAAILLEPVSRDTAPAIAAAAGFAAARDPNAMLLVLAADHVIRDTVGFVETVREALAAAEAGRIVVFGIAPDYPATGYGYIRPGDATGQGDAMSVAAFVEKPDEAKARQLIAEGCLWNSGMFLMSAAVAVAETERHAPDIARAAAAAVAGAATDGPVTLLDARAFADAPRLSIDFAVMEKTDRAAVVAARFDWSDLGAWSAVWDAAAKDAAGNVVSGDAVLVDARNAYVSTDAQRIGVVGLDDVVVVAADGAVLVTSRARAADVKDLVGAIDERPEKVIGDYVRHYRPWGHYQSLDQGPRHQVKRIVVESGQRLSLQKHAHRAEHWTVVDGIAEITVGMERDTLEVKTVRPGEHVHIPKGAIHRMANPGDAQMTLIEVQSGDYLGEDDIVRLEDDYGR
jgi:mannose-1-phosphate guanylyltransferase/mannose-6-phosphate isomerase